MLLVTLIRFTERRFHVLGDLLKCFIKMLFAFIMIYQVRFPVLLIAFVLTQRYIVYNAYGGTVISTEEGSRIAAALGPKNRSVILRNHGMITCGHTVDEAAFLFIALDRCCHAQMMANAAAGPGWEKIYIGEKEAEMTHKKSGNPSKMWLAFQPYYDQVVHEEPSVLN
jgi:ribulose-5-phosphate 4-epimerase/fuculose-1-phosphate aldolase